MPSLPSSRRSSAARSIRGTSTRCARRCRSVGAPRSIGSTSAGSRAVGLETKVRLFLRSRRVRFRTQAPLEGVGLVDVLVGDRLVIEVDGWGFHRSQSQFENDRRRDFELVARGYLVLRLSYRQVMHDWERTSAGILALLARQEHRWRIGPGGTGPFPAV
ncbi:endonuclease domain-containing protein [Agromyces aureus]|uniref:DUF559 domain-containing protein n=1 Tax=Agromyces aureus TaxID=453304 RepID=A0A191WBE7_9MICO|nr:DUF559 domain-containing protein [Agromyces aureus]ANJ25580.1 hypothetical protein ATC03_01120 [Agromyces aureus]